MDQPKTVFHISCDNSSTTKILTVNSNNEHIRNIVAQNKNKRGIVTHTNDNNSKILFFNDNSINTVSSNAVIQYASGEFLQLSTTEELKQRSRKLFINTPSGQFMMDNSGITLQSSESIFIDSSSGFLLDTSQGFIEFDSSAGSFAIGTSDDFILQSSVSGGYFKLNKDQGILTTSGEIFLNASGGLLDINATEEGEIKVESNIFNINASVDIAPSEKTISSVKIYGETWTIYDSSNVTFLKDVYDLSDVQTGTGLNLVSVNPLSNTNMKLITPTEGKGAQYGGGVFPNDDTINMGLIGLTDICRGFIVNQTIASNPNRKKYLSSIGINTYSPLVDKFVMNINGPVYMSNGEINTMISSNFEIFNMHFSKSHPLCGIATGSPSSVTDGSYSQFLIYTKNGGIDWELSNIYEKENTYEVAEGVVSASLNTFTECFMIDNSYGLVSGNNSAFYYTNNGAVDWYRLGYGPSYETVVSTALAGHKVIIDGNPIYRFYNAFQGANYKSKIRMFDISQSHIDASLNGQSDILHVISPTYETTTNSDYQLKGSQINGLTAGEESGQSVSINGDGTIVAIGSWFNHEGPGSNAGTTRIYEWNGSVWVLKGSQINGLTSGEFSGYSVSINSTGTIVAIGAFGNNSNTGTTRIYEWNGTAWVLKGSQINGLTSGENSGYSVSINGTGTIVAIGAFSFDGGVGNNSGTTRIYEWNGTAWVLKGSQINGLTADERSGWQVSISSNGNIVAIGANANNSNTGTTRIYEWNGTAWVLKGSQINGLTSGENSGYSVSINGTGTIVAIGAYSNDEGPGSDSGTTRIYEWNGTAWVLKGSQINGLTSGEQSGFSVSLSSNGTSVAIGAKSFDGGVGFNSGTTRIYEWNGTAWTLKKQINGLQTGESSGFSVSFSSNGTSVAIGANSFDGGGGNNSGTTRIYQFEPATST